MIHKPRSLLLYGRTKVGKTSNIKMLASWFYERHKQKIRLITSDGGGYRPFFDSDNLIGKGIVEVFDNTDRELALQDIHRLADGHWPNKSGELVRDVQMDNNKNYRANKFAKEEIGAYFIEGTGSLSETLLTHFSDQLVTQKSIGFEAPWIYQEGDYAVAGIQPGHFGIIQRELHKLIVKKFCQLPVKLIVFTGKAVIGLETTHKTKKNGEKFATSSGEAIFGPEGPGVALTSKIPSWFENCLFIEPYKFKLASENKEKEGRRAWYRTHTKRIMIEGVPTDVPYLAGSSCPAERYEEMEEKFKGGFVKLGFQRGIDQYLEWLESIDTQ